MHKGKQTKKQILATALNVATMSSLNELTIGKLATMTGMSKSGLFGHFNSKENLQVEVLEYARSIFVERVIMPVQDIDSPLEKLMSTVEHWVDWYESQAKSCIFVSASSEFDDQPGAVRDVVKRQLNEWLNYLVSVVNDAMNAGELKGDAEQFVFELYSLYLGSQHMQWVGFEHEHHSRFKMALSSLVNRYQ